MLQNPVVLGFEPCPAAQQVPWGSCVCHLAGAAGEGWPGLCAGPKTAPWFLAPQLQCPPLGQAAWRAFGNNIPNNFTVGCCFFFYFGSVWVFLSLSHLPTNPKEFGSI